MQKKGERQMYSQKGRFFGIPVQIFTHEWLERSGSSSGILSAAPRKVAPFSSQKYSSFPHPNNVNQRLELKIKLKIFSFSD